MFGRWTTGHESGVSNDTPQLAFALHDGPASEDGIVVHVNFGIFTGREASLAEVDRLAGALLERVEQVTIVSEVRHEIDRHSEAAVHQVRIEVPAGGDGDVERWLLQQAQLWARRCIEDRTVGTVS